MAFASLLLLSVGSACAAQISLTSVAPTQGQVIEVSVKGVRAQTDTAPHVVKFNSSSYRLFPAGNDVGGMPTGHALLGIPADLRPGKYKLECDTDSVDLSVKAGKFPLQHLRLPPGKDNFLMSPGEEEAVEGAKATCSDKRLWRGLFLLHVQVRRKFMA